MADAAGAGAASVRAPASASGSGRPDATSARGSSAAGAAGATSAAPSERSARGSGRASARSGGGGVDNLALVPAAGTSARSGKGALAAKFGVVGSPEEIEAANKIIGLYRIRAARRRLREVLKGVVAKYFDESSGYYYYYNEKTGDTTWTKPVLLGSEDITAYGEDDEVKSADLAPPGTRPRKGECLCIPNSDQEQLAAATALFSTFARMVQIRCTNAERPYRTIFKVDKGEEPDVEQNLRIIVFDRPVPNMTRILVKHAVKPERCGLLTEYARVRPVSEYLNYDDWGDFWASYAPQPGMTMYYVRYTHSPYRCLVTTDSRVGAIWRPHFAFFGYEAAKFSVRASPDGGRYIVALPGLMEDWPLCFEFVAFTHPLPGASKINVLERHDPELRHKICAGKTAIRAGWKLQFSFFALDVPVPGTTKFSVQQCREPFDQCRVWQHMPMPPWLQAMYFYAFKP